MRDDDLRHWDSPRIRENHDYPDYDPDGELDRWLVRVIWVMMCFGIWKILDLAWAAVLWVAR